MRARVVAPAVAVFLTLSLVAAAGAQSTEELNRQKLREEIHKLQLENRNASGLRGWLYSGTAGFGAIAVAIIGGAVTLRNQRREAANQRAAGEKQHEEQQEHAQQQRQREIDQRELEGERRLDARFDEILVQLGADSDAVQAGAAVSLLSFLRHDRERFHQQVRLVTLANLKVIHAPAVIQLLIRIYEQARRPDETLQGVELDFSGAILSGADLGGLDLSGAKLDKARLEDANLTGTTLVQVHGFDVCLDRARLGSKANLARAELRGASCIATIFHSTRLDSAKLHGADLTNAEFQGAMLQSAHFDGATIAGTRFDRANVADAFFFGATFDDKALASLARARNLDKVNIEPEVKAELDRLSSEKEK